MPQCAECRAEETSNLELLACGCHVHKACFELRETLCRESGVHAFLCAKCWSVVWNAGKRKQADEDNGEEKFKKLRM